MPVLIYPIQLFKGNFVDILLFSRDGTAPVIYMTHNLGTDGPLQRRVLFAEALATGRQAVVVANKPDAGHELRRALESALLAVGQPTGDLGVLDFFANSEIGSNLEYCPWTGGLAEVAAKLALIHFEWVHYVRETAIVGSVPNRALLVEHQADLLARLQEAGGPDWLDPGVASLIPLLWPSERSSLLALLSGAPAAARAGCLAEEPLAYGTLGSMFSSRRILLLLLPPPTYTGKARLLSLCVQQDVQRFLHVDHFFRKKVEY